MSPRRKTEGAPAFGDLPARLSPKWLPAAVFAALGAMLAAALTVSALVLFSHEQHERAKYRDVEAISYVRSFITQFTSPDPFNANAYAEDILGQATGKLAEEYRAKLNEVVVAVARSEPTKGEVIDAGVERWNDDGSASVVVVTKTTTTMPDGQRVEGGSRWVARTIKEGDRWRISDLAQVI